MATQTQPVTRKPRGVALRNTSLAGAALLTMVFMAMDTKVIVIGSAEDVQADKFLPKEFGDAQFPTVRAFVEQRAAEAQALVAALEEDKSAAVEQHGTPGSIGPFMSVKFTGVVGEGKRGMYKVAVPGVPENLTIRVQTGPAINGTELRDATGDIKFGQFTNQIEYQDAGAAINNAMKDAVLSTINADELTGKTILVVGVFTMINPKNWMVTPVRLEVQ